MEVQLYFPLNPKAQSSSAGRSSSEAHASCMDGIALILTGISWTHQSYYTCSTDEVGSNKSEAGGEELVLSCCIAMDGQDEERGEISSFYLKFALLYVWHRVQNGHLLRK